MNLWNYQLAASPDPAKTDLELRHVTCGEHLCDAQHLDCLAVLNSVAAAHASACSQP
ncbi:hypothetical protein [Streptomyces nanshensis]|uniref:hypothetical protein n=1 Tax=Streptomyces nanshensis TaxID=518642 RepID=UPI001495A158|nr:hypothetical protein [Streptomyces nanshensis]